MKKKDSKYNTFIIAEAGVNHNGSLRLARKMIDAACAARADAVKFQTFKTDSMVSTIAPKARYQTKTIGSTKSQYEMLKGLELGYGEHKELINYCKKKRIIFISSPFDLESIDMLDSLGLEILKIPSGEIVNLPYLSKIGRLKKRIMLSTGMSDLNEIKDALSILTSAGTTKEYITVLHCNTEYPTSMEDVNLRAMLSIKEKFDVKIGYSDHTLGTEVPITAVALGASVIEKHFTLDRNMQGPDHKASLEPVELKAMIKAIRNIEKALGNGIKKPSLSELKNKSIVRKSIVASKDIEKGEIFTENNITTKRPATGISPMRWNEAIGKKSKRDFKKDELVEL